MAKKQPERKFNENRIFVINDPNAPRLCPELAREIGLNESLLYLQMEFWIATLPGKEADEKKWIYMSTRDIQKFFCFWGVATVHRTIQSLIKQELLFVRGDLNTAAYDKTQWFAINPAGLKWLGSIRLMEKEEGGGKPRDGTEEPPESMEHHVPRRNEAFQDGTANHQDGTTIPETPKTSSERKKEIYKERKIASPSEEETKTDSSPNHLSLFELFMEKRKENYLNSKDTPVPETNETMPPEKPRSVLDNPEREAEFNKRYMESTYSTEPEAKPEVAENPAMNMEDTEEWRESMRVAKEFFDNVEEEKRAGRGSMVRRPVQNVENHAVNGVGNVLGAGIEYLIAKERASPVRHPAPDF